MAGYINRHVDNAAHEMKPNNVRASQAKSSPQAQRRLSMNLKKCIFAVAVITLAAFWSVPVSLAQQNPKIKVLTFAPLTC